MNLKIGDKVKVVSLPDLGGANYAGIKIGMTGTVKELYGNSVGVEFDEYIGGHNGIWEGKDGHCWCVAHECLKKIEDTEEETKEEAEETKEEVNEETKAETFEQKILEVLRKEIGVDIGEEFDVYEKGNMLWTCKFKGNGFSLKYGNVFHESAVWKDIVGNFHRYTFKRKQFVPKYEKGYFFLRVEYDENKNINFSVSQYTWIGDTIDYGMLALGNVFRSKEEALANKDKLLEKLEKLRQGE